MEFSRESIIVSAVRTFCKSFAGIIGILVGIILVFIGLMMFSAPDIFPPKSSLVISPDANGNRDLLPHTAPVILKMDIMGVVGQGDLTYEKFQNSLFDSRDGMLAGNRVKAILLYINTPGGTVDDADGIYRALMDYKKKYQVPVYAYVDGMCCSGGMYIASAADKIFASPSSIIGSVGVILGPAFNFSGLMDKYGVQAMTITQGKDKDMLSPFRPWVPGEDASLRKITADLYDRFVSIVTTARPLLNKDKLVAEYGAQIFVSKQAQELGYIDVADTDYNNAVTELVKAAKLPEEQFYQVMTIEPAHPFLSDLTSGKFNLFSGKVTHQFQINSSMNSELSGRFLYLYQPN
ncbi:MAG: S49 family peptidase [Verrucomicrobia bacterium]|nr:S49 family peptidase [Verrucomicrobiota bacterium]